MRNHNGRSEKKKGDNITSHNICYVKFTGISYLLPKSKSFFYFLLDFFRP
ncbi:hypothetical protein MFUM_90017 [Methylacidiphilum fumariolicum SolV]|uniref:Uncharacterized protein n=2 Tax=Candidatus Methylacidiphilum fumarolicum TaxID=591154 RepID=I0K0K7_METFB|nr:conserved protein of unknown function [Candidatus Methylacidiphilum fumarolicum]CCG93026.1 hypothetical protein MFUM_90017 [Methylacidiphilum fumariolicum SolV]